MPIASLIGAGSPAASLTKRGAGSHIPASVAVICFVVAGIGALSPALAVPAGQLVWPALITATPAVVVTAFRPRRLAAAMTTLAVPATLLSAGFPLRAALTPRGWYEIVVGLTTSTAHAVGAHGQPAGVPRLVASMMLAAGALWTLGAALGASSEVASRSACGKRVRRLLGFGLLAAPWLAAVCLKVPNHSAWQGAVVLVAGALWFAAGRAAVCLAVLVAAPAAALAHALGPSSQWFGLVGPSSPAPAFAAIETEPTYGPLSDRRTGATMLIVTAPAPALWRMQALDYSDGLWIADSAGLPELPEPAARRENVSVRVVGLRQGLTVAPGWIDRVSARGQVARIGGEGVVIGPNPATGSTYRVQAAYVHPSAAELAADRAPLDAAAREYTHVETMPVPRNQLQRLRSLLGPLAALLPAASPPPLDPRVAALARQLAKGARTEWAIVARVERYLVESGRFRYTTSVPPPGAQPLVDFLLRTHAGYCQHFAGAAALLLRLAGVPARVVSGFATGTQIGPDQYAVRDLDAHEWIEVYFEGYGWVPFNPTPAADPAVIAGGIDPLVPSAHPARTPEGLYAGAGLLSAAVAGAVIRRRRRRSATASDDWLWRVVRRAGGEIVPSTTLADVRRLLEARVGPCTAALATEIEHRRFAAAWPSEARRPCIRLQRAVLADLGALGALLFWARPTGPRRRR